MAVVEQLLREEAKGTISFGNYELETKAKLENFRHGEDILKVKTFREITKLEKNDLFCYESVPGTAVNDFAEGEEGLSFTVEGPEDAEITLGLKPSTSYKVYLNDTEEEEVKTSLGGKVTISVELEEGRPVSIRIKEKA